MAIGAVAAFLLAGPLTSLYKSNAVASRPQPSTSPTIDPHASPTSCPASLPMPKTATTVTPSAAPALPFAVWVNEPLGAKLGDGPMMASQQADYEIQMVWCRESPAKIHEARKLLGLEAGTRAGSLAG